MVEKAPVYTPEGSGGENRPHYQRFPAGRTDRRRASPSRVPLSRTLYLLSGHRERGVRKHHAGETSFSRSPWPTWDNLIGKVEEGRGRKALQSVVTMVATNLIEWIIPWSSGAQKGVESKWTPLENRGGNISSALELAPGGKELVRFVNCSRLFKQAYILSTGTWSLCCTDYTRKVGPRQRW